MVSAFLLTVALSATAAQPGQVVNHAHPGHYAQPTIREYERFDTDLSRRMRYDEYVAKLDEAWKVYRKSSSTPAAFHQYKLIARQLKSQYVSDDPYLTMVLPGTGLPGANTSTDASDGRSLLKDCPTDSTTTGSATTEPSCEAR